MSNSELGYLSPRYAESFRGFGDVIILPNSGLSLLRRPIDETHHDWLGLYPFSVARDWRAFDEDLRLLKRLGGVSVVFVVDPFTASSARESLSRLAICKRFKTQFIVDLSEDWRALRAQNVRNSARQALRSLNVAVVADPLDYTERFWELYQHTLRRHRPVGVQRLSQEAIARQLEVEGAVLVVASRDELLVGAMLSYDQGGVCHVHLHGQIPDGYKMKCSYGLIHRTLEALEDRGCTHANLGGAAGNHDEPEDGLYRFKSRWTPHREESLLCGEVLDPLAYEALVSRPGHPPTTFFPAYRAPGGGFEWRPAT